MQKKCCVIPPFCLFAFFAMSGAAFAGGNHVGGHGHDSVDAAVGKPGIAARVGRTINVTMTDNMRFSPSSIQVRRGETVRFVVKNEGQLKHELSLGSQKELLEHLEMMKKFPTMEHDEPSNVTLIPGKQGEIVWQFTKAGTVSFACLLPGHYEAGMRGVVKVVQQ